MPVFNVSATGFCPVFKDQRQIVIAVEKSSFLSSGVEYVPRRYDCPCSLHKAACQRSYFFESKTFSVFIFT